MLEIPGAIDCVPPMKRALVSVQEGAAEFNLALRPETATLLVQAVLRAQRVVTEPAMAPRPALVVDKTVELVERPAAMEAVTEGKLALRVAQTVVRARPLALPAKLAAAAAASILLVIALTAAPAAMLVLDQASASADVVKPAVLHA
jgi:hypothetical protein